MIKSFVFIASIAFSSWLALPPVSELKGPERVRSSSEQLETIYPHNIDCRDFEMTNTQVWRLRNRSSVDLGNWDGAFWISGAISRGLFVKKGFDLLDVLEAKCGMGSQNVTARHPQG